MPTPMIQTSFSSGEVSPSLFGRVDLAKFRTGAATMRNFFVDYRGGATSRPGTEYILAARSWATVRLIKFQFSVIQNYVLEFGDYYMRVLKDGAFVEEDPLTILAVNNGNPCLVTTNAPHGYNTGDWVTLYNIGGMTGLSSKTFIVTFASSNSFYLSDLFYQAVDALSFGAYTGGGTCARVYTLTTPWPQEILYDLGYTQSADVMTICHPDYPPKNLNRYGHASWTITDINFDSAIDPPATLAISTTSAGTVRFGYTVTAVSDDGEESVAADPIFVNSVDITSTAGTIAIAWTAVAGAAFYNVYKTQISPSLDIPVGSTFGFLGTSFGLQFNDGNVIADFTKTPPKHFNPFAQRPIIDVVVAAQGSGYTTSDTITVTDSTGSGAKLVPIVVSGEVVGVIIEDGGKNYTAPTLTVSGGTGAALAAVMGPSTGTYPATVTYFQQRLVFGGSTNRPQTLWGSQTGFYNNFDKSVPIIDSDSYELTLASQQVNHIQHMVSMPGGLVVLTTGGAWQISGGQNGEAVTPTQAVATPQAYNGCAHNPQPLVLNYDILYVQDRGSTVRDLSYNYFVNIYTGTDLTILSNHLFRNHTITSWDWAEEPFKVVWAARGDGTLLSLTFLKEQEIYGWARHDTQGQIMDVCTITEDEQDAVYLVVRRLIRGYWVQYIERMANRVFENSPSGFAAENAWCVDAGLELEPDWPGTNLYVSAKSGSVSLVTSDALWNPGDVGKIIRGGGGIIRLDTYLTSTSAEGTVIRELTKVMVDDPAERPLPIYAGEWNYVAPVTTLSGLDHLDGETVKILADGGVVADQVVTNGTITLSEPASKIVVGLGYTCQLETLNLESEPTIQGRRKRVAALTVRMDKTRGLSAGPNFDALTDIKEAAPNFGVANDLFTGDKRIIIAQSYNTEGRICLQQSYPLPATVLAVIPEVTVGDTVSP